SDDGVTTSFQRSQNSRPPRLDHQDKYMMKAQVHVSKSSAISDIQALPRRKYFYCQVLELEGSTQGCPLVSVEVLRSRTDPTLLNDSKMAAEGNNDLPVPNLWTMQELCQPSLNGRGGPISPIAIQETNFRLKNDMIQQVQNSCQFHGLPALKAEMAEINKNLMRVLQVNQQVKAVTPSYKTCCGPHSFSDCLAIIGNTQNVYAAGAYQGNIITNLKEDLKGITTRSGTAYQGPTNPTTSSSLVVERKTEATKDMDLNFNISFADALILMSKFGPSIKSLLTNKDKLCELARTPVNEHCSAVLLKKLSEKLGDPSKFLIPCDFLRMAECLALANLGASINLMPLSVWNMLSLPNLSPMCMTLELTDHLISHPVGVTKDVFVKVGTFHFLADFVVIDFDADPRVPLILGRSFLKTERALIDVFKVELTLCVGKEAITFNLDHTLRYSTNYNDMTANRIDVIDMACEYDFLLEEVDAFLVLEDDLTSLEVDQSYVDTKGGILLLEAFLNNDPSLPPPNQGNYLPQVRKELKIYEAKSDKSSIDEPPEGIDPAFYTHKILMEEDFEPAVQHQRRVNPKIHNVIKNEGGFTIVEKEENELMPTPLVTGWRVCIDYHQENTTFTCQYATFAYRRMPFGLCNAPGTFQRCMMAIFHDMIEKTMEVLMDDFSVFENSFQTCLSYLERMLKQCEDTNLCLNWEKSHFMVKEGIVLGHKISKNGIEADKAKVDVITKLLHPTTVKAEKEMLAVVYAFEKFRSYLIMNKSIVYTNNSALKYLFAKKDSKARLLRWVLLLQEFTFKVTDIKRAKNLAADHLSRLENPHQNVLDPKEINELFLLETLNLSKWVEAKALPTNDARVVCKFLKNLFAIFGTLRAIIRDRGTHFCNDQFAKVILKFGVTHRLTTPYHPQTSGQLEVSNLDLKRILERTVGENHASWLDKLDDALWAFQTTYKTPIGCTPYKLIYGKACHLPIELEHKAYWALKLANFDLQTAGDHRKVQLNELRDQAYENSLIYKEKTKRLHGSKIKDRVFNIVDRVLL
nr:reverse transcriptase domain-containing protein [Tanacetum cinerariifolium]